MQKYYSIEEIVTQKLLPFSKITVERKIRSGEIRAKNIRSKDCPQWVVTPEDIQSWWDSRETNVK